MVTQADRKATSDADLRAIQLDARPLFDQPWCDKCHKPIDPDKVEWDWQGYPFHPKCFERHLQP